MNRKDIKFFFQPSSFSVCGVHMLHSEYKGKKTLKTITGGWEQSVFLVLEVKSHNHSDNDSNFAIILDDFKNVV